MKSSVELLRDTVSAQKKKIQENKAEEEGKKKIQENKAEEEGKNNLYFSDILMYCFVNVVFSTVNLDFLKVKKCR